MESLTKTNQTSQTTSINLEKFEALDLTSTFINFFNNEAQNIIANHKATHLVHQWNEHMSNSKFEGPETHKLADLLTKIKLKEVDDLYVSNYVRRISVVHFFGWTVEESKLTDAILDLVNMVNDLCSKSLIRAMMSPLLSIKLADGKYVVVSYFAIDQANESLVKSMYHCSFKEGAMPPELK